MEYNEPVFAVLGWDGKVHIGFKDGKYFPYDRELSPQYYKKDENFPHDPEIGKPLEIISDKYVKGGK